MLIEKRNAFTIITTFSSATSPFPMIDPFSVPQSIVPLPSSVCKEAKKRFQASDCLNGFEGFVVATRS